MTDVKTASPKSFKRVILIVALSGLAVVVLLVAMAGFSIWYYSWRQEFARSKPVFEAFAAKAMATDSTTPIILPRHLGAFEVSDLHRLPDGILFRADFGNPFDWNGFAYSAQPLPKEIDDPLEPSNKMYCTPIEGNWYSVNRN